MGDVRGLEKQVFKTRSYLLLGAILDEISQGKTVDMQRRLERLPAAPELAGARSAAAQFNSAVLFLSIKHNNEHCTILCLRPVTLVHGQVLAAEKVVSIYSRGGRPGQSPLCPSPTEALQPTRYY